MLTFHFIAHSSMDKSEKEQANTWRKMKQLQNSSSGILGMEIENTY